MPIFRNICVTSDRFIHTSRLYLRPSKPEDAATMTEMLSDPEVSGPIAIFKQPYDHQDSINWCRMAESKTDWLMSVFRKDDDAQIGCFALTLDKPDQKDFVIDRERPEESHNSLTAKSAEIGCWIGKMYWRNKYATEVLDAALFLAFDHLSLEKVHASTAQDNLKPQGLLNTKSFMKEDSSFGRATANGNKRTSYQFEMTADQWRASHGRQESIPGSLDDLRNEIDAIDKGLIELLKKRNEVVNRVAKVKGNCKIYTRPGREARLMQRLFKLAGNDLNKAYVWHLWREIISSSTLSEGSMSIALTKPLWDLARNHYGIQVPLSIKKSNGEVLDSISQGKNSVALLPFPNERGCGNWWPWLMENPRHKVFAAVPRMPNSNAKNKMALVVAELIPEPSGSDKTLIGLTYSTEEALKDSEKSLRSLFPIDFVRAGKSKQHGRVALAQLDGFWEEKALRQNKLGRGIHWLGAYSVPPSLT